MPQGLELEQRVAQLVHGHRQELAALVRQVVDRELALLVDAEIASRNGNGSPIGEPPNGVVKVCKTCGRSEPAVRFDPHRHECRACRTARARERKAQAAQADDGPRPAETVAT